jgi:uncharacterized delta-60 repeat protein
MAKTLQFRRDTTANLASVTGAEGEIFIDLTKDTVVVMDGSTSGGFPLATESYVETAISNLVDSAPGTLDTLNELAAALGDDANFSTSISNTVASAGSYANSAYTQANTASVNSTSAGSYANSAFGIANTASVNSTSASSYANAAFAVANTGVTNAATADQKAVSAGSYANSAYTQANTGTVLAQAAFNAANTGGGGSADFSQVSEDILPLFSDVYDIGSTNKRWYDVYVGNNVDINGSQLTANGGVMSTTSDFVVGSLLADDILISDNMITPDDTTAREYLGDKGIVAINGNLDVQGDWVKVSKVETVAIPGIPAGTVDTSFDYGTGFFNDTQNALISDVVKQPDGKILVCGLFISYNGTSVNNLVRLNSDGTLDTTFNFSSGYGFISKIGLLSTGKIAIVGNFTNSFAILNSDGSVSNDGSSVSFNDIVQSIAVQSDDKIIVGGAFDTVGGTLSRGIVRINPDGTRDTSFDVGQGFLSGGYDPTITTIKIFDDNKIYVGGYFTSYKGTSVSSLCALSSNGDLYKDFVSGLVGIVNSIEQVGNSILVGGSLSSYRGSTIYGLALIANATDPILIAAPVITSRFGNPQINSVYLASDGKIFICGVFRTISGISISGLARFNSNLTLDNTFESKLTSGFVDSISEITDDKIIIRVNDTVNSFTYDGRISDFVQIYSTSTPDVSSPPLTTGEAALIRYNSDISAFEGHNGTNWTAFATETGTPNIGTVTPIYIQGETFASADMTIGKGTNIGFGKPSAAFRTFLQSLANGTLPIKFRAVETDQIYNGVFTLGAISTDLSDMVIIDVVSWTSYGSSLDPLSSGQSTLLLTNTTVATSGDHAPVIVGLASYGNQYLPVYQ